MRKYLILVSLFITVILLLTCCDETNSKAGKVADNNSDGIKFEDLTQEEKDQYEKIKKSIDNNSPYEFYFSEQQSEIGQIKYDFNNDGKIEILEYATKTGEGPYGYKEVQECKITFAGESVEQKSDYIDNAEGISCIGIIDTIKNDNCTEVYITDGYLRGGTAVIYRLTDKGIENAGEVDGGIEATSGDGKIYYWGGNLYESYNEGKFDTNLVLTYYDINRKEYVNTDQIIGKTITSDREIIVYKTAEDVIDGAPLEEEEIIRRSKGKTVTTIKINEKYKVISLDNGVKIMTEDGKTGWIGGFHMVWD